MDVKYGQDNLEPVIRRTGKRLFKLEFKILNIGTTYYFFENEEIEKQFKEKKLLDEGSEVCFLNYKPKNNENKKDPASNDSDNKKDPDLVFKLKLIDANLCPGSCIFMFWIYKLTSDNELDKPELYIYAGGYCLTDAIKDELKSLRESEDVKKVTMVNDNTRVGEEDCALETDKAIAEMKDFIESWKGRSSEPITVKIGADWGMEDLWISLVKEYSGCLYVSNQRYKEICNCMDKNNAEDVKERPEEKNGITQNEGAETQEEGADTQEEDTDTQEEDTDTQEEDTDTQEEDTDTQEEGAETQEEGGKTQEEGGKTQDGKVNVK